MHLLGQHKSKTKEVIHDLALSAGADLKNVHRFVHVIGHRRLGVFLCQSYDFLSPTLPHDFSQSSIICSIKVLVAEQENEWKFQVYVISLSQIEHYRGLIHS